eukprot:TRINITY_DN19910_c0_g2_i1.p1 TRINITY_DN19910_c0_g2~~TRINITY_DN19910_c0_g2_i1.p1  ORF type:complete len:181 (+),score=64.92 TRINITY_DN19910_c0_g2_i1:124-666(+)
MFFRVRLMHHVHVDPMHFHEELAKVVKYQLCKDVEGTIDEDYGFIVAVDTSGRPGTDLQVGPGVLMDTGVSSFKVYYTAIVIRPFEGEVIDAVVEQVRDIGLIALIGPGIEVFISSKASMPQEYKFDSTNPNQPKFVADDDDTILKGDQVRLRIKGVQVTSTEIKVVGELTGDFMGKISA